MSVIFEAAFQLTEVEAATLELETQLCDGSILKGYTSKKFADVDMEKAFHAYAKLQLAMEILDDKMEAINSAQIAIDNAGPIEQDKDLKGQIMGKLLQFTKVEAAHKKDRSVRPVSNPVRCITVYTDKGCAREPAYYWLLPHILCVIVNGASVYIDMGEQK